MAKSATPTAARAPATVAAGFVTGLLSGMYAAGRDPLPLIDAAGVNPNCLIDPGVRVPLARYTELYNLVVRELDDEAFGLFSQPMMVGSFELLCRAIVSAPTLARALERATRYLRILLPDITVTLRRKGDTAHLVVAERQPLADSTDDPRRIFAYEWLLRLIHGLACWLVGRGLALDRVAFPYPWPPHAGDYALIYTEHAEFGAPMLDAAFEASLLDLPIRRDEAAVSLFLNGAPASITALYRRDREMVLKVREMLRSALPANLDLDRAASALHVSPRTLHRRLAEEGTSFRAVKDALRRDLALVRLAAGDEPVAKIAADLGYADASAFFRAVSGWTGTGPTDYRRRMAGSGR
jgi:AraC-like DNA-binding protein